MKRPKRLLLLGGGAAALLIGAVVSSDRPSAIVQPLRRTPEAAPARHLAAIYSPSETAPSDEPAAEPSADPAASTSAPGATSAEVAPVAAESPDEKAPATDPEAREALFFVGVDPQAEVYWLTAINDPTLPEGERQDLIEDLNQEGIPDPAHPAPEDLPLIRSRLALIEQVGSDAMDQVNAYAFAEAYKDLLELAMLASQTPPP